MSDPGAQLVRVTTAEHDHPREGMIVCRDHLSQAIGAEDPPFVAESLPADQVRFWNHRCLMCSVDPAPGRLCENPDCRRPLHPQWPAVYCSNTCALEDL